MEIGYKASIKASNSYHSSTSWNNKKSLKRTNESSVSFTSWLLPQTGTRLNILKVTFENAIHSFIETHMVSKGRLIFQFAIAATWSFSLLSKTCKLELWFWLYESCDISLSNFLMFVCFRKFRFKRFSKFNDRVQNS